LHDGKLIATFFSLKTLETTTKGFANEQKLKVGGFGIVYKGTLDLTHLVG
jgi:hypothetical protein